MKIVIEHDGFELVIEPHQISDFRLATPAGVVEVPCTCATPCNLVHRELIREWHIELQADLTEVPQWRSIARAS